MNRIIKRFKSKTYKAALLGTVLTAIEIHSGFLAGILPEAYRQWAIMFWPVLMLTLREMTTGSLEDK